MGTRSLESETWGIHLDTRTLEIVYFLGSAVNDFSSVGVKKLACHITGIVTGKKNV